MSERSGVVYLVGAGPGDPGLLTRRGEALLRRADVVVYDRLVAPALLDLCPPSVERIYVGKDAHHHAVPQEEINRRLVGLGRAGRRVVRLKGGDPFVFGRGGEEALALRAAGVPFEVVPGVSSSIAAAAYAGIPVTHRGVASSVLIATGHEDPAKASSAHDWQALARGADTLVFLMGIEHLSAIVRELLAAGRPPDLPAALIREGTTPRQETLRATLGTIIGAARERGLRPPAVLVVGAVVELSLQLAWIERRPLHGRRILVTRAREQASTLALRLTDLGAETLELPAIAVAPAPDTGRLDRALGGLGAYSWVIFTSANGVAAVFDRLGFHGRDARAFQSARVAAVGPATATALESRGIRADLVAKIATSDGLLTALRPSVGQDERVLLLRADIASTSLPKALGQLGARVDDVAAYRTVPDLTAANQVRQRLARQQIDVVTFTSASTVRNLVEGLAGESHLLAGTLVACIGPTTAAAARELGLSVDVLANAHTIDGLVAALVDRLGRGGSAREVRRR